MRKKGLLALMIIGLLFQYVMAESKVKAKKGWTALTEMKISENLPVKMNEEPGKICWLLPLASIRLMLEKAGINEPVTLELTGLDGQIIGTIGTFAPDLAREKLPNPSEKIGLNPQPEPPIFRPVFSTMPVEQQFTLNAGVVLSGTEMTLPNNSIWSGKLVFKNALGEVKASSDIQLNIRQQTIIDRERKPVTK